jgi:hypothetical protein
MEAVSTSETSVNFYRTARRSIPEVLSSASGLLFRIRWPSRGEQLKPPGGGVQNFMGSNEKCVHVFQHTHFACYLGFFVDITGHLNDLSCRLQGKDQFDHTLNSVSAVLRGKRSYGNAN